jgi:hypothetical protein
VEKAICIIGTIILVIAIVVMLFALNDPDENHTLHLSRTDITIDSQKINWERE